MENIAIEDLHIHLKVPSKGLDEYLKSTFSFFRKLSRVRQMIIRRRNYQTIKRQAPRFDEDLRRVEAKTEAVRALMMRIFDSLVERAFVQKKPHERYVDLEVQLFDEAFREHFNAKYEGRQPKLYFAGNKQSENMLLTNYDRKDHTDLKQKQMQLRLEDRVAPQSGPEAKPSRSEKSFKVFLEKFKQIPLSFSRCEVVRAGLDDKVLRVRLSEPELPQSVARESEVEFHMAAQPRFAILADDTQRLELEFREVRSEQVFVFQVRSRNAHGLGNWGPVFAVKAPPLYRRAARVLLGSLRPEEAFAAEEYSACKRVTAAEVSKLVPGFDAKTNAPGIPALKEFRDVQRKAPLEIADLKFGPSYLGLTRECIVFQHGRVQQICQEDDGQYVEEGLADQVFYPLGNQVLVGQVFCGADSSFAISLQMELYSWGLNRFGELGTGDLRPRSEPVKVDFGSQVVRTFFSAKGGRS